jgi:hypothetical protein
MLRSERWAIGRRLRALAVLGVAVFVILTVIRTGIAQDGRDARAHLWIDSDGGNCTRAKKPKRYDDARACAGLGEAYNAANKTADASTVVIKGGRYGPQDLIGDRPSGGRIVFREAPREQAEFDGSVVLGVGSDGPDQGPDRVTLRGLTTGRFGDGFENPSNRFGLYILAGASHVRIVDMKQGGFLVQGASDIEFVGGSYGPCRAAVSGENPCEINKVDHAACSTECTARRVVVDGVDFHDYDYGPACLAAPEQNGDGCHHRSMYINGVHGFTLRNSTFRDSVFAPWTTHSGARAAELGTQDVLVENNQFGARANYTAGSYARQASSLQFAWCANTGQPSYRNVVVRFNSFARGATIDVPGAIPEESACQVQDFEVYGNIIGWRPDCGQGVSWRYNLYVGGPRGVCGPGDVRARGNAMAFYKRDTPAPLPGDFRLRGKPGRPDNLVPAAAGCPKRDAAGARRGRSGRCDAGAFERR